MIPAWRRRWTLALAGTTVAALSVAGAPASRPALISLPDGACTLSALPPLLSNAELVPYLKSGLTTTLVLTVTVKNGTQKTPISARVDVRFEPWDEIFYVALHSPEGDERRSRHASLRALEEWWGELSLTLPLRAPPGARAKVDLSVVPFSEGEEADTRQWYAAALRGTQTPDERRQSGPFADMLDALSLASIKRRDVMKFSWSVFVSGEPR